MLKITADTNILVSAVIAKGNEFKLLRQAKAGKIRLILPLQILEEFMGVISRAKFGFSARQITNVFKQIMRICNLVAPSARINILKDDPDDHRVLECAESGKVDYIVSGDSHLLDLKEYKGIKIVRSYEFLRLV